MTAPVPRSAAPDTERVEKAARARILHSLRSFTVATEAEALKEPNPDVRRGMAAVTELLHALITVEEMRP